MAAIAIGGLHKDIVRLFDVGGVPDDGLVRIADIAGEHQFCGIFALGDPQLNAGRAQQMAHIHKARLNARRQLHALFIVYSPEQLHGRFGILYGIHGLHRLCTGTLALAVFPFGFKFLNMGRVP